MIMRRVIACTASVLLGLSGLAASAGTARADDFCDYQDSTHPVITGYAPSSVAVGPNPSIVTFSVQATDECGIDGWTVDTGKGSVFAYEQNPTTKVYGWSNSDAGLSYADVEAYDVAYNKTLKRFPFRLLRATYWSKADAGPEPVKKGKKVRIKGILKRADWDRNVWVSYGRKSQRAAIQFKAQGQTSFRTVKTVTLNTRSAVDTKVTATHSGTYRLVYAGNSVSGASTSVADFVQVR